MLRASFNVLWFLSNSLLINFCQFAAYYLLRPFDTSLYRAFMGSVIQSLWVEIASSCFSKTELMLCGDIPMDATRPAILLVNHQIDSDWWYLFQLARTARAAGNIKIVLKEQLKYIPVLGWGMRWFDFLFLRRRLIHDARHIKNYMDAMIKDEFPFWLVFFPEGTTIHKEYLIKSQTFAEKEQRPHLDYLLLPRVSGLQVILDAVQAAEPDIYDLTIAFPTYSGEIPTSKMGYTRSQDTGIPSIKSLLAQRRASAPVWIHGQKFRFSEIKNLQDFLDTQWIAKEKKLQYFIQHQRLPADEYRHVSLPSSKIVVVRLWLGFLVLCCLLPFFTFSFVPLYVTWTIYSFIYSMFDRTTSFLWPYILHLIQSK